MKVNIDVLISFVIASVVFSISMFFSPLYLYGDQELYRELYENLATMNFIEGLVYYRTKVLSDEIGHYIIVWFFSDWLNKDILISFSNFFLAYLGSMLLLIEKAHPIVVFFVVALGYYSWSLYLSAERLKFSTLFLLLSILLVSKGKAKLGIVSMAISLITHLQHILTYALMFVGKNYFDIKNSILKLKLKKSLLLLSVLSLIVGAFLVGAFGEHLGRKISAYKSEFPISEYLRMCVFFVLSLFYCKKRFGMVIFLFVILFSAVYFVGGMRVNLIGYFSFLYFAVKVNRGINAGVMITSAYYLLGLVDYLGNTVNCGENTCS